jgi:hypothetical protein
MLCVIGFTASILVSYHGDLPIAGLLVANGADVDAKTTPVRRVTVAFWFHLGERDLETGKAGSV